jgi:hypothetical protein
MLLQEPKGSSLEFFFMRTETDQNVPWFLREGSYKRQFHKDKRSIAVSTLTARLWAAV